jgi:peptidoglycan-N-acetylglucosamine deacetylase
MQTLAPNRPVAPPPPTIRGLPQWARPFLLSLVPVLLALLVVADSRPPGAAAGAHPAPAGPRLLRLEVRGRPVLLRPGLTLAQGVHLLRLAPRDGALLAVDGTVLEPGVYPGRILLNGRAAPGQTRLASGDRIAVVDARDQTEPLVRTTVPVRGNEPSDPQFSLATGPGVAVITLGKVSRKTVATVFRPTGPVHVPPAVALTFDDGPWPGTTMQILQLLNAAHARATFFLIGRQAVRHPELVRAELDSDMRVECHSWSHPQPFAKLPPERIRQEIQQGRDALEHLGVRPTLFRPPGGSLSPLVLSTAQEQGMRSVIWSVDPHDWKAGTTRDQIVQRVLGAVRPGSIVLLHDGGGNRSATVAALPEILAGIRARGLQLAPLA